LVLDKTTCDFGRVKPGSSHTAVFHLMNEGSGVLKIRDVLKCCGAVVRVEKNELTPGESGAITAEYRVPYGSGITTKRIVVVTNDPKNSQKDLTVTGEVVQTLTWNPTQFRLPVYAPEKCPEITIRNLDRTPFSITGFTASGKAIIARFDPNHKATEFTLKPVVDVAKLKALTTPVCSIIVDLDHPDYRTISVPFEVTQPLEIAPPQIVFFDAKAGELLASVVQVQDNQGDPNAGVPLGVDSMTAKFGGRVNLRSVSPKKAGCDLNLEIWPAMGKDNEAFSSDQLVVKLKDGRELTVPLRVFFQSPTVSSTAGQSSTK
jgi:hypothetical protein